MKEKGPPCKTCQPESWPINRLVLEIYNSCASQVRMSMSGPVSIDEQAVMNRINLKVDLGIVKKNEREDILNKVVMVANMTINLRNESARAKQENK